MSAEKNRCGIDSSKCTDWTTTRRAGYKPGADESIEPPYTATRSLHGNEKSSTRSTQRNKSSSKKKSTASTNKSNKSLERSATSNRSNSVKRSPNSNTSMIRTAAAYE